MNVRQLMLVLVIALAATFGSASPAHAQWFEMLSTGRDAPDLPVPADRPFGVGINPFILGEIGNNPTIPPENDVDMYALWVPDGPAFSATTCDAFTTIPNTQLYLFDASGAQVFSNDDDPACASPLLSTIPGGSIGLPGTYYLAVTGQSNSPVFVGPPGHVERWVHVAGANVGLYRINLTGACFPGYSMEIGDAGNFQTAIPVPGPAFGATTGGAFAVDFGTLINVALPPCGTPALSAINGVLDDERDVDVYCIRITGGGSFGASTCNYFTAFSADTDTQLYLLDGLGRGIMKNDDDPVCPPAISSGAESTLPYFHALTPTGPGVYYLVVTRFDVEPTSYDDASVPPASSGITGADIANGDSMFPDDAAAVLGPDGLSGRGGGGRPSGITYYTGMGDLDPLRYDVYLTGAEIVSDVVPPLLSCDLSIPGPLPNARVPQLLPANGQLPTVRFTRPGFPTAFDPVTGVVLPFTVAVFSNEDDETPSNLGVISPDCKPPLVPMFPGIRLRRERVPGFADGRIYVITIEAATLAGNAGACFRWVGVPQLRNRTSVALNRLAGFEAQDFSEVFRVTPPSYFLCGDGAVIGVPQ